MSKKLIYLASPYWHKLASVRRQRFLQVSKMAAYLMQGGRVNVFSPVSHTHPISEFVDDRLVGARDFWLDQDYAVLGSCDELWVYCIDGWNESEGIKREVRYCEERNIRVRFIGSST